MNWTNQTLISLNVPTSLNNLKTKVDDSDIGELKTVPIDLKKFSDVVNKEIVKNKKKLHTKDNIKQFRKQKFLMQLC